jgi:MerR family transcriptional regulator, thiopeptide resistance regulator
MATSAQIPALRVGELAKRTGLSVRALHHYEEIGLLAPGRQGSGGHRRYSAADVARLQQIRSLRQIGLSLGEIRECLASPSFTLRRVVELHVTRLRERIAREEDLFRRLEQLLRRLSATPKVEVDEILYALEGIALAERYFTADQRRWIAERAKNYSVAAARRDARKWQTLMDEVAEAMERGDDPRSAKVRRLAARWHKLVLGFTRGDPGITQSLRNQFEHEPTIRGMDTSRMRAMTRYLAAAMPRSKK